jgi:hypothetical protein
MGNRFYYGMPATDAFKAMNALEDDVNVSAATAASNAQAAAGSASASASRASEAAAARDAALAAWRASTAPAEQLAPLSQNVHSGAIVDCFLYDTSRDSDGGAWRKRCKHTSWENETLVPGKWLGIKNDINNAFASGAVAGDYYYSLGASKFMMVQGTAAAPAFTEVFRGSSREFPALALIVAEPMRVVIYDAAQPGLPMWMVLGQTSWDKGIPVTNNVNCAIKTVVARDGSIWTAGQGVVNGSTIGSMSRISFLHDGAFMYGGPGWNYIFGIGAKIADRHTTDVTNYAVAGGGLLLNSACSDVDVTVLPDAPIDPATGLPVPTVAVATNSGLTLMKQDGSLANTGSGNAYNHVCLQGGRIRGMYFAHMIDLGAVAMAGTVLSLPADSALVENGSNSINKTSRYIANPLGASSITKTGLTRDSFGCTKGLVRTRMGHKAENSMVCGITNAYNSGWQVGDSRGAWLADVNAEVLTGQVELVNNGTFNTDTAGWTAGGGAGQTTLSVVGGAMRVTNVAAQFGYAAQFIGGLTIGKSYTLTYSKTPGTGAGIVKVGTTQGGGEVGNGVTSGFTFTATTASVYIAFLAGSNIAGQYCDFDNISVQGNIVVNGTFESDLSGWNLTVGGASTITWVNGTAQIAPDGTNPAYLAQQVTLVPGRAYTMTFTISGSPLIPLVGTTFSNGNIFGTGAATYAAGTYAVTFIAPQSAVWISFTRTAAIIGVLDNVSVKVADYDRSVKNGGLNVYGTVTKSAVAAGAQLMGYSGFSAANYLEQALTPDLDFGASDLCVMGWASTNGAGPLLALEHPTAGDGFVVAPHQTINNTLQAYTGRGGLNKRYDFTAAGVVPLDGSWFFFCIYKKNSTWYASVNGSPASGVIAGLYNTIPSGSVLRIGTSLGTMLAGACNGKLALIRVTGSIPSDDMLAQIYRDELALFQSRAQCTLDGTSATVTSMEQDDFTDLLHIGTSWGRNTFKGLQRTESAATSVGQVNAMSATMGAVLMGGTQGVRFTQPAMQLRDELRLAYGVRRGEALSPSPFWFTATGALASFTLPIGYDIHAVYRQGMLMRNGGPNDYTATFDGYRWTVTFSTNVPSNYNICIMGVRNGEN